MAFTLSILYYKRERGGGRERGKGEKESVVCFQEMDILQARDFAHSNEIIVTSFPFLSIARPSTLMFNLVPRVASNL